MASGSLHGGRPQHRCARPRRKRLADGLGHPQILLIGAIGGNAGLGVFPGQRLGHEQIAARLIRDHSQRLRIDLGADRVAGHRRVRGAQPIDDRTQRCRIEHVGHARTVADVGDGAARRLGCFEHVDGRLEAAHHVGRSQRRPFAQRGNGLGDLGAARRGKAVASVDTASRSSATICTRSVGRMPASIVSSAASAVSR